MTLVAVIVIGLACYILWSYSWAFTLSPWECEEFDL